MDNVLGENVREISMDKVLRWDCRAALVLRPIGPEETIN